MQQHSAGPPREPGRLTLTLQGDQRWKGGGESERGEWHKESILPKKAGSGVGEGEAEAAKRAVEQNV